MKALLIRLAAIQSVIFIAQLNAFGTTATDVDTIKVIQNAHNITVTRQGNQTEIKALIPDGNNRTGDIFTYRVNVSESSNSGVENITADDISIQLPFMKHKSDNDNQHQRYHKRIITGLKYYYWGWNFNYDGKSGIKNSFEVGVADVIGIDWHTSRKTILGVGLGLGFNRVTSDEHMLFVKNNDCLGVQAAPENSEVDYARWDTWRIHIPLMFTQKLYKDFAVGFAGIINLNTYSRATNRYRIENTRYTETIKGLNQQLLTFDIMATVGFHGYLGVYAKWSPVKSMQIENGPSFRNFSIGVNLNF